LTVSTTPSTPSLAAATVGTVSSSSSSRCKESSRGSSNRPQFRRSPLRPPCSGEVSDRFRPRPPPPTCSSASW
jgi:hypothetical protein